MTSSTIKPIPLQCWRQYTLTIVQSFGFWLPLLSWILALSQSLLSWLHSLTFLPAWTAKDSLLSRPAPDTQRDAQFCTVTRPHRHTYSHGQKYWHPCTSVRQGTTSLRKLLQLQMLWYSSIFLLFALEKHETQEKKAKSAIIPHRTPKMDWTKWLGFQKERSFG